VKWLHKLEQASKIIATVLKDIALITLGVWGIWHEEHTGQPHPELLIVYTSILCIPTATHVLAYWNQSRRTSDTDTTSSPSSSPDSSSRSSSSSSSLGRLVDDPEETRGL
jgi:hypothetical protein